MSFFPLFYCEIKVRGHDSFSYSPTSWLNSLLLTTTLSSVVELVLGLFVLKYMCLLSNFSLDEVSHSSAPVP